MLIHPSGERFFDTLDGEIIGKASLAMYNALFEFVPYGGTVVLSGGFGKKVADGIDSGKFPQFSYILFQGGIRSGNKPIILREKDPTVGMVFLDDSIYGGATYEAIKKHLDGMLSSCAVIYDGCPVVKPEIKSLFRYYDHFESTPNFKF